MKQADFICIECPISSCDPESLWCVRSWVDKPNEAQLRARTQARGKGVRKDRRQYFKDYYRKRLANGGAMTTGDIA